MSAASDDALRLLREADGDPSLLVVATIAFTFADLSSDERDELLVALEAAAVPHWCDEPTLRALLDVNESSAAILWRRLSTLTVLEPFPARGEHAANVHEKTRRALRRRLATNDRGRLDHYSATIADRLAADEGTAGRIEYIYHLLMSEPDRARRLLERATSDWLVDIDNESIRGLELSLRELLEDDLLDGVAQLRARITLASVAMNRGELGALDDFEFLDDALASGDAFLISDARAVRCVRAMLIEDWTEAQAQIDELLPLWSGIIERDPDDRVRVRELASVIDLASQVAKSRGDTHGALEWKRTSLDLRGHLVELDPAHRGYRRELAEALESSGRLADVAGDSESGETLLRQSLVQWSELTEQSNADVSEDHHGLANTAVGLAQMAMRQGDVEVASFAVTSAVPVLERLVDAEPANLMWRSSLGSALLTASMLRHAMGESDRAREHAESALNLFEELELADPSPVRRNALAEVYRLVAWLAQLRGDDSTERAAQQQADALSNDADGPEPDTDT